MKYNIFTWIDFNCKVIRHVFALSQNFNNIASRLKLISHYLNRCVSKIMTCVLYVRCSLHFKFNRKSYATELPIYISKLNLLLYSKHKPSNMFLLLFKMFSSNTEHGRNQSEKKLATDWTTRLTDYDVFLRPFKYAF